MKTSKQTPISKTALLEYGELIKARTAAEFDSYDKAIEEIIRLRTQRTNDFILGMNYKRPPGRPKKYVWKGSMLSFFEEPLHLPKKKGGRPRKDNLKDMLRVIADFESLKQEYLQIKGKYLTDRELITRIADVKENIKTLRWDKKQEAINTMCTRLKYYRDETGIRQRKKSGKP